MNTIFVSGNMVDAAKVGSSEDLKWARFSIANSKGKDKGANFFNCVAFGKTAEIVESYGGKGASVILTGKLSQGEYTNKEGNSVKTVEIMVNEVTFTGAKKEHKTEAESAANMGFMQIDDSVSDDGLPFN